MQLINLMSYIKSNIDNPVFYLCLLLIFVPVLVKKYRFLTTLIAIACCFYFYTNFQNYNELKNEAVKENVSNMVTKTKDKVSEKANTVKDKVSDVLDKNTENYNQKQEEKKKESKILNENQKDSLNATTEATTGKFYEFENELAEYYNNLDNFETYQNQNEIKTDDDERANTALADLENEK
ncbi:MULTISPECIES: hypothetical protein [Enterococcus]|uniref:hypothetical protein n=1 Tax=Enterococcus TaxID=1350 RepID=UPI00211C0FE2|nr:hypothetical protein [Enterococcus faecalis]WCG31241.1 hypothetical protein PML73_05095 [Enterococcus faecalis]